MTVRTQVGRLLDRVLARLSYRLIKRKASLALSSALKRVIGRNISIQSVIDVGASDGMWTKIARTFLPSANYLLIEANTIHEPALKEYVTSLADTEYRLVAGGAEDGRIFFDASDPFGGAASYEKQESYIELPVRSIDSLVDELQLAPPYLLKLDTHGFEVPIFEGATKTLEETNLIIVEVYNFRITQDSLLFNEMCDYLGKKGFRVIDLCDPLFREHDEAFWQADFFFIRADSNEFQHNSYK
jgi:FkbM family methyltransferase